MPGEIVHIEIPADDTGESREFWGALFGWQFESFPGPSEYHMTRISDQTGGAITNMEPGKKGTRPYFSVDDINAGAARVKELGGTAERGDAGSAHGLVRDVHRPARQRVRPLAERHVGPGADRLAPARGDCPARGTVPVVLEDPGNK